jgi:hypothetical protein
MHPTERTYTMRLKWLRLALPLAVLLALVFAFTSCGDDDDEGGGGGGGGASGSTGIPEEFAAPTAAPKRGATSR